MPKDAPPRAGNSQWRLPPINDRWWPLVRGVLIGLLAITFVMEVVGLKVNYERGVIKPFAHVGLSGWKTIDGQAYLRAPHTSEAQNAGLREGQVLIAVDGIAVGNRVAEMQQVDRLLAGPEGSKVVLRTRDANGKVAEHQVTRSKRNADALYAGSGITSSQGVAIMMATQALPDFFLLFVATILLRSRRRETVGLLFAFGFTGLVLTGPATYSLWSSDWQVLASKVIGATTLFALAVALLAFPSGRFVGRWQQLILIVAGAATIGPVLLGASNDEMWLALAMGFAIVLPTLALIFRARRAGSLAERLQIRYALLGFTAATLLAVLSVLCWTIMPAQPIANAAVSTWLYLGGMVLGALAMIALAGGLLLSLIRYRLYDVDTVMSRSAAYGLMTVGFVAAFAGLENLLEQAAQTYFSDNAGKAAGALSAALAAALIGPMHNRIHAWTEQRFRKGLVAMRRDLPNAIDDLRETATFAEMAATVETAVARGVTADWVRLRGPETLGAGDIDQRGELERTIAAPDGRALALLEVGPRPDGSAHGKDEREAIDALVEPLARALLVIERREAKEVALDRRIGLLEAAVAKLTRGPRKKPA